MSPATVGIAQQITLVSAEPPIRVTGIRGAEAPKILGGYGGWTTVPRPRKKALTEWQGIQPLTLRVPLLFDGHPDDSVELQCARLEQLAGTVLTRVGGRSEPPLLRVIGAVPHSTSVGVDWVVADNGLDWTEPILYSQNGYRTRQAVNVTLLQYVADDRVDTLGAAEQARLEALEQAARRAREAGVGGAPPAHAKHYTVKQGDSLSSIAADQLGDFRRWVEIAALNDILDPRRVRVGQVLRLP